MPHPRLLDRPAIVAATIEVLDERGLDKVSLHAVAARLGVRQPALYHHFRDKAEILAAVADEVLDRWHTDRLPRDGERWDEFLDRNARSLRRAMLSVRDGARLLAMAGSRSPNVSNAVAQVRFLERHGFSGPNAILAFIAVSRYTIGCGLEQQTARDGAAIVVPTRTTEPGATEPGATEPGATEPGATHLAALAAQVTALGSDHEFDVGLAALIRGLEAVSESP